MEAGLASFEHRLPADASEAELLDLVARLNADPAVDGILVQLPLPPQIAAQRVIDAIDPGQGRGRVSCPSMSGGCGAAARRWCRARRGAA